MNRNLAILLAVIVLGGGSALYAQEKPTPNRVGYVNVESVIRAHPDFPQVEAIYKQADAELGPLNQQIEAIQAKIRANQATDKDRQDYQNLGNTYNETSKKWEEQANAKLQPITQKIDQVVATVAQSQGVAIVMNYEVARQSALVIYADQSTDLTTLVSQQIAKK